MFKRLGSNHEDLMLKEKIKMALYKNLAIEGNSKWALSLTKQMLKSFEKIGSNKSNLETDPS